MPFSIARSLNIFLSYAHEDQKIADAIASILRMAFFDTFDVTLMSEFPIGVNWRELISESIEKTDILIAIASGRLKPSHSFTGFEIGSFTTSMRHRPNMELAPTVVRRMIPFAALDRRPTTTDEFEGIDIDPKSLHALRFDASQASLEIGRLSPDGTDRATKVIVKFLSDIQDIITEVLPERSISLSHSRERIEFFNSLAFSLCQTLFAEISNREEEVKIPKSKLIIRIPSSVAADPLLQAEVETQGPCFDSFGIREENWRSNWQNFLKRTPHPDIAWAWHASFSSLTGPSNKNEFVENNTILSFDRTRTYRVFVSRIATLFSGLREFHVYVIPLLKPKDYGDPVTTLLLKALQISLGYRFMFLETASEFSPEIFEATRLSQLKSKVIELQNGLNMLLQTADDNGLNDAEHVYMIMGKQKIDDLYTLWDKEKNALYDAASRVLSVEPVTSDIKDAFVARLETFCERTHDMNKNYSTRVMQALTARMQ
jgi:hypothetical protein